MGRWGDGVWGDGEMGRWGDGEMGRWGDRKYFYSVSDIYQVQSIFFPPQDAVANGTNHNRC
ncbi:MAG: hypothetical protein F6K50_18820 [Moorea sp. SIO3I7]|nr:hypothetical protein [Moorena sp. SIO3I7]NEO09753.1 hypothetical protein [Moorena sp. SIO3I8]